MDLILMLLVLPTIIAFGILALIWKKLCKTRPFLASFLAFTLGVAPLLFVGLAFGINPWEPSYGVLLVGPTYGPALLGIVFLVVGFAVGLRKAWPDLVQLIKDVRDGQQE